MLKTLLKIFRFLDDKIADVSKMFLSAKTVIIKLNYLSTIIFSAEKNIISRFVRDLLQNKISSLLEKHSHQLIT